MYRVFPSTYIKIVSALLLQVHKNNTRDSKAVVTPFMQDGTYPSRNFATLGPSGLWPPFTGTYILDCYLEISSCSIGQVSDFIHYITILQNLMFLLNSRCFLFLVYILFFLSRSYKVNLPSSFSIIYFFVFISSTKIPVLDLIRF